MEKIGKVIRDGQVAVLVSPGFGAGWYSWNGIEALLFHPQLVELVEANRREEITQELLFELTGEEHVYAGGAEDLEIVWVPIGTQFLIDEYDGAESLTFIENLRPITA